MSDALKIIFMGTPDFACEALKAIVEHSSHEVIALYSQPPRPKGRGHKLTPSPTHAYADEKGIPVYTPKSLKSEEEQKTFAALNADVAVVAAYGLLLPKAILEAPKYGCLNIHASLLPRWRGASPIQRSIWAGDDETGVTIMQMDEGLDTGPMIEKARVAITNETTCAALHHDLAAIGGETILSVLNQLANSGQIELEVQDDARTCYAPLLKKEDGRIRFDQTAQEIDRQIRALNPWPGTYAEIQNEKLKILEAIQIDKSDMNGKPGEVLSKKGHIMCGENTVLQITKIQPAGKKPMDFASALNGGYLKIGDIFE